jgi:protein-S-isoprenylcysteine O-methyltransferase Ste14
MKIKSEKTVKTTTWAVTIFYLLIAFEFFYMASPFAIYFYSVYRPGLETLDKFPIISWMTRFFLPHIVQDTKSPLINALGIIGGVIAIFGLLIFFICATQVYYKKIFRKGVVTGGFYRLIRHPQYTGFALSSFGMLLIWPRYLVLITFITMMFVYYFLARVEEKECETKFGKSYTDYKNKTFMFLPFRISFFKYIFKESTKMIVKVFVYITFYFFSVILSVIIANQIRSLSVNMLYATFDNRMVSLSVIKNDNKQIADIMSIVYSNPKVDSVMKVVKEQNEIYLVNYILPGNMYHISEIPMNIPSNIACDYNEQTNDKNAMKVIIAQANLNTNENVSGQNILLHTQSTTSLIEVWLDLSTKKVIKTLDPPKLRRYTNIPVPVF